MNHLWRRFEVMMQVTGWVKPPSLFIIFGSISEHFSLNNNLLQIISFCSWDMVSFQIFWHNNFIPHSFLEILNILAPHPNSINEWCMFIWSFYDCFWLWLLTASDVALVEDPEELEVYGKETVQSTSSNVMTFAFEVSIRSSWDEVIISVQCFSILLILKRY